MDDVGVKFRVIDRHRDIPAIACRKLPVLIREPITVVFPVSSAQRPLLVHQRHAHEQRALILPRELRRKRRTPLDVRHQQDFLYVQN